jgi:outer membrane protein insertion porin family
LTRLNNLGVFKSVNISYIKSLTDSLAHLLDVNMDLLMADNINLAFEADLPTKSSGYIDQSGDIKLESNLEFRFDMSKMLKGALFIETGNIWLVNEDENRPGAKFDKNTFYDQLAVDTGFGLRFDFTFFIMRVDIGLPIRTPYKTDGKNWITNTNQAVSGAIFNLAIGYPF